MAIAGASEPLRECDVQMDKTEWRNKGKADNAPDGLNAAIVSPSAEMNQRLGDVFSVLPHGVNPHILTLNPDMIGIIALYAR